MHKQPCLAPNFDSANLFGLFVLDLIGNIQYLSVFPSFTFEDIIYHTAVTIWKTLMVQYQIQC